MILRAGDLIAGVCMDTINHENMQKYFDLLEEVCDELDFRNHPERTDVLYRWPTMPVM